MHPPKKISLSSYSQTMLPSFALVITGFQTNSHSNMMAKYHASILMRRKKQRYPKPYSQPSPKEKLINKFIDIQLPAWAGAPTCGQLEGGTDIYAPIFGRDQATCPRRIQSLHKGQSWATLRRLWQPANTKIKGAFLVPIHLMYTSFKQGSTTPHVPKCLPYTHIKLLNNVHKPTRKQSYYLHKVSEPHLCLQ